MINESENIVETIYEHGATVVALCKYINPEIPWIWIINHLPNERLEWWKTSIPINKTEQIKNLFVRNIKYDIQMPTKDFLLHANEFNEFGIWLIQSFKEMPNTLLVEDIIDSKKNKILFNNGAFLKIYLPHAIETAKIDCFQQGYLEKYKET